MERGQVLPVQQSCNTAPLRYYIKWFGYDVKAKNS